MKRAIARIISTKLYLYVVNLTSWWVNTLVSITLESVEKWFGRNKVATPPSRRACSFSHDLILAYRRLVK